jgi:hypothetical protein
MTNYSRLEKNRLWRSLSAVFVILVGIGLSGSTTFADATTDPATGGSVALIPSPDILSCKVGAPVLFFEDNVPAYDKISADCALNQDAIVTAYVYNKSYDPKSQDNSANLVKTIFLPTQKVAGNFSVSWNGYDDYDQAVALDNYSFVVEAKLDDTYLPDISIQKFKVDNLPSPVAPATPVATTIPDTTVAPATTTTSSATGADTSPAATSSTTTSTSTTETVHAAAAAPIPSKCPGVNYPSDIDNSPDKDLILKAYDLCFIKGYDDGTFKGKQNLTRAESTKIAVLAAGEIAKQGCYDADCGSPFVDLDMWQGPWVRAAWDLKIVGGVSPSQFAPNRSITKAESASLIDKALKIAPHTGCYNAGCGAGYPDDLFLDVIHAWEGPFLRALWDKQAIHSVEPHKFFPDKAITREQFIEILMKARG